MYRYIFLLTLLLSILFSKTETFIMSSSPKYNNVFDIISFVKTDVSDKKNSYRDFCYATLEYLERYPVTLQHNNIIFMYFYRKDGEMVNDIKIVSGECVPYKSLQ